MIADSQIMKRKSILIAGSASWGCSDDKLDIANMFVRSFTREVLSREGRIVVLGAGDDATNEKGGATRIFDWVALREVESYASSTTKPQNRLAIIVMSDDARAKKLSRENLKVLRNLEQRRAVSVNYLRREQFTGGAYRAEQMNRADAMLAIGGGKGTYALGREMTDQGKPVLALDLQIGSLSNDGDGALALHKETMDSPDHFFPFTHQEMVGKLGLVSLESGINNVEQVARVAAELIEAELSALPPTQSTETKPRRVPAAFVGWFNDRSNLQLVLSLWETIKSFFS